MPDIKDWSAVKAEYITGDLSLRKLAEKHGISRSSVLEHSKREEWVKQRDRYRASVVSKTVALTRDKEAKRFQKLIDTTSKAVDVCAEALSDDKQLYRHLINRKEMYAEPVTAEDGETMLGMREWTEERVYGKIDTKALRDLTSTLKELTALMRDFYDIPTPAQREAQRIAAERLELDKQRNAPPQAEEGSYGVVVMPAIEELKPPEGADDDG